MPDQTDTPAAGQYIRGPAVAGTPAIERLMGQVRQEARTIPGPAPTLHQVAMVLHALADHTAIMAALDHRPDPTSPWPHATSIGRWLHDVGHQARECALDQALNQQGDTQGDTQQDAGTAAGQPGRERTGAVDDGLLRHYSRALDDIYRTRLLAGHEADVLEATLGYKTFPKGRRDVTEAQVARLRAIADGRSEPAFQAGLAASSTLRRRAGQETLTRAAFEAETGTSPA